MPSTLPHGHPQAAMILLFQPSLRPPPPLLVVPVSHGVNPAPLQTNLLRTHLDFSSFPAPICIHTKYTRYFTDSRLRRQRRRIAPVRLPVKRCVFPLRVVQPISVTSRSSLPSFSLADATPSASSADGAPFGRCLIAIELRNDHPVTEVTVHDIEAHVDATARSGERGSTLEFSAPGKARGGGAAALARRTMSGGTVAGGATAPLEVLQLCGVVWLFHG